MLGRTLLSFHDLLLFQGRKSNYSQRVLERYNTTLMGAHFFFHVVKTMYQPQEYQNPLMQYSSTVLISLTGYDIAFHSHMQTYITCMFYPPLLFLTHPFSDFSVRILHGWGSRGGVAFHNSIRFVLCWCTWHC